MKTILGLFLFLILNQCCGQGLNVELGFNDDFDQVSGPLVCGGSFVYFIKYQNHTVGSSAPGCYATASLLCIDTSGLTQWETDLPREAGTGIQTLKLISTAGGNVYVSGSVTYMWSQENPEWFLSKIDSVGTLVWTHYYPNESGGLTEDENQRLLVNSWSPDTSVLISLDLNGMIVDSIVIGESGLKKINSISNNRKLSFTGDSLLCFDSFGDLSIPISFSVPITDFAIVSDTIYILSRDSIFSYDAFFQPISANSISGYADYSRLRVVGETLRFLSTSATEQHVIAVNHALQLINVTTLPVEEVEADYVDFNEYHFATTSDFELTRFSAIRYLDYSLQSAQDAFVNRTDIEVANVNVTQLDIQPYPEILPTYYLTIYADALVKNHGNTLLESCRLNHYVSFYNECGYEIFTQDYQVNIPAGDSAWISMGLIESHRNSLPGQDTLWKNVCVYSSHPNGITDLNVSNDNYCARVIAGYVGIPAVEGTLHRKRIRITDILGREAEDKPNTLLIYQYSDGSAQKVFRLE